MTSHTNSTKLSKEYEFADFKTALEFVNKVGEIAEKLSHHPEIYLTWGKVVVESCTHDDGNKVTGKDVELMEAVDGVFESK
jgi:4a-hydroxytetrahydrobiopterin dehydratase